MGRQRGQKKKKKEWRRIDGKCHTHSVELPLVGELRAADTDLPFSYSPFCQTNSFVDFFPLLSKVPGHPEAVLKSSVFRQDCWLLAVLPLKLQIESGLKKRQGQPSETEHTAGLLNTRPHNTPWKAPTVCFRLRNRSSSPRILKG